MAASEAIPLIALATLLGLGCAGRSTEPEPASQAEQQVAATHEAAAATPPPPAETPDDTVVYVDGAEEEDSGPTTLAEVARRERKRRAASGPPVAVITNQSLEEYQDARLTFLTESPAPPAPNEAGSEAEPAATGPAAEEYWRSRALDARLRWREAVDRIDTLSEDVSRLQREFYATDDPAQRDQVIKPAWDLALAELDEARRESVTARTELQELLEEGRRSGALPGWLREGIEIEPERPPENQGLPTIEPGEPDVVEEREP